MFPITSRISHLQRIFCCGAGSVWAKELLEQYNDRHFVLEDGSLDLTTNTSVITEYMKSKGLILSK